jgi:hypothetical protein
MKNGVDVQVECRRPTLLRDGQDVSRRRAPSTVDQNVGSADLTVTRLYKPRYLFRLGDIARREMAAHTPFGKRLNQAPGFLIVSPSIETEIRSRVGECQSDGRANAFRAPCNQAGLSLKIHDFR